MPSAPDMASVVPRPHRNSYAIDKLVERLGLSDYESQELRDSFSPVELTDASMGELSIVVMQRALPFMAAKRRRQVRDSHQCPDGRFQGRIYYGNGRCGLCDSYHGLRRELLTWHS